MCFRQINKTEERVFLDEHPLVRFCTYPIEQFSITDGRTMRLKTVETKLTKIDLVDRLRHDVKTHRRMFIICPPNDNEVYWEETYDPYNFHRICTIRMAEIEISESEWEFLIQARHRTKPCENEPDEKKNNNYKFLLIGR